MNDNIYPRLLYYLHQNNYKIDETIYEKVSLLHSNIGYSIEKFNIPDIAKPTISLLLTYDEDDVNKFVEICNKQLLRARFKQSEFYDCIVDMIDDTKNK